MEKTVLRIQRQGCLKLQRTDTSRSMLFRCIMQSIMEESFTNINTKAERAIGSQLFLLLTAAPSLLSLNTSRLTLGMEPSVHETSSFPRIGIRNTNGWTLLMLLLSQCKRARLVFRSSCSWASENLVVGSAPYS